MIVAHARQYLRDNPTDCSLCAALQAMLAYARGLEQCSISVSASGGRIILSGEVDSTDAMETAIAAAEVFSGRGVTIDLSVRPRFYVPEIQSLRGSGSVANDNIY